MACTCSRGCWGKQLRQNRLLLVTVLGVALGIALGLCLRTLDVSEEAKTWIRLWGELFLRMLKALILPLIMACLVTGIASMEGAASGRLGVVTVLYVLISHLIAVTLAVVMATIIRPGRWWDQTDDAPPPKQDDVAFSDIFADFMRNLFPDNIVKACLQSAYTDANLTVTNDNGTNFTSYSKTLLYRDGTNTMGVIVFSAALGFALSLCGEDGKPLYSVFKSLEKVIFKLMLGVIWYSPIGIVSLVASALMDVASLQATFTSVGLYLLTLMLTMALYLFLLQPLSYLLIVRRNPFPFYFSMLEGLLTAFAVPSSVAAMPGFFSAFKDKLHMDGRVADFCIPILVTINRGGSGIFIAISAIFSAQTYGIHIGLSESVLIVVLTSTLSPAVAAVPSSSIMVLITVCGALSVPLADRLAVIFAIEWLNDRVRTAVNASSSGYGCAIIERTCKAYLKTTTETELDNEEMDSFINKNEQSSNKKCNVYD